MYEVFRKLEGRRTSLKPSRRWKDIIEKILKKGGIRKHLIYFDQNRYYLAEFCKRENAALVPQNKRIFNRRKPLSFLIINLLLEITYVIIL
jgi:hypothetical protein